MEVERKGFIFELRPTTALSHWKYVLCGLNNLDTLVGTCFKNPKPLQLHIAAVIPINPLVKEGAGTVTIS